MDTILAAASRALGHPLSDPVDLGGGSRSTVVRCRTPNGATVVVKAYGDTAHSIGGFTAEASALAFGLAGPELLAVDRDFPLVVLADLGPWPTLADVLLGDDAETARDGVLAWAAGLGDLGARAHGRRAELAELRTRYDRGEPGWDSDPWLLTSIRKLPGTLTAAGVTPPPGLDADLVDIGALTGDAYPVFTPGDTCADNNVLTPDGLRLLDFEGAGYVSAFLTAAYARMPFSSCWCVFRLPPDLARRAEDTYRAALVLGYPELADDSVWGPGVRRAVAAWTLAVTAGLLPSALAADRPMHPRRPSPTARQLLTHRWGLLADELTAAGELPAVAATVGTLLELTKEWDAPALGLFPAFGG
ncbi:hypothetical protein AB0M43_01975 [Longispora sp. NPDC051575]|uniref:hypothetical protein n=1 Tax=Longispora sp. NPDC051575 TaxID=3154943 RepID=UPI0034299718